MNDHNLYSSLINTINKLYNAELEKSYVDLTLVCRLRGAMLDVRYCEKHELDPLDTLRLYHLRVYQLIFNEYP